MSKTRVGRRALTVVAMGLFAVAGCFGGFGTPPPPPRPTEICAQSFGSASNYSTAFFNLGHADTRWVTADGFAPVHLPDGRTAWWMSDTMTGTANPDNSVPNAGNVHNSIVKQSGGCLTPTFGAPEMFPGVGGAWFWPGSSVVQGNTLTVFAYKVVPATGQPGFDWKVVGTSVARFALPSLQLLGAPVDMPVNNAPNGGAPVPWGIRSVLNADGMVYLYGTTKYSIGSFGVAADAWLARAPVGQPTSLEYFTNPLLPTDPSWSTSFADAKPMTFTKNVLPDSSPAAQLSVVPYGNRYLAGAFAADVLQDSQGRSFVRAWTSDTPQGPWAMVTTTTGQPRDVATFTRRTADQIAYDARIESLPGPGWTAVYNANDPIRQWQDFTLYRGEFEAPNGLPSP